MFGVESVLTLAPALRKRRLRQSCTYTTDTCKTYKYYNVNRFLKGSVLLWCGAAKNPPMNVFLAPIIEEVNKLYTKGTTCMHMLLTMCTSGHK